MTNTRSDFRKITEWQKGADGRPFRTYEMRTARGWRKYRQVFGKQPVTGRYEWFRHLDHAPTLDWLGEQGYANPRVCLTVADAMVGVWESNHALCLALLDGSEVSP